MMPSCYYYDEQRNRCNCYVNENLNELLAENAKLREQIDAAHMSRLLTENENESLRELVWDIMNDAFEQRMRDLGIEGSE